MPEYLRALIYILILAVPTFYVAGRLAIPIIGAKEFALWRNTWLAATCLVFLTQSFVLFAVLLSLLIVFVRRKVEEPLHLYIILMFVAPCLGVGIGIPGLIGRLMDLNLPRLLALVILLPIAIKLWSQDEKKTLRGIDIPVIGFFLMLTVLALRHGDFNSFVRVVPSYFLDILLPYYVFSRTIGSAADVNKCLLAFAVAAMPLAMVGMFEYVRAWRIYYVVVLRWDLAMASPYLFRDGSLRAAATSIEPIAFGFLCMVGAGALLSIRSIKIGSLWWSMAIAILMGGLYASISRGPWLGFALGVVIMVLANPKAAIKLCLLAVPVVIGIVQISSGAMIDRFINLLPFVGHADEGSENYRSELFLNSMEVIKRNPLFGSLDFLSAPELQSLIQGQGIIDIVNSYVQIALEYGLISLGLFVLFFGIIVAKLAGLTLIDRKTPLRHEGALAILIAILFSIATTSSVSIIPHVYWAISGLAVAWIGVASAYRNPMTGQAKWGQVNHAAEILEPSRSPDPIRLRVLGRGI